MVTVALFVANACASGVSPRSSSAPEPTGTPAVSPSPKAMPTATPLVSPSASPSSDITPQGAWIAAAPMATARAGHTATLLSDGTVLAAGDNDGGRTAETYDPKSGAWTATGPMVRARTAFTATLLRDGRVLVVGGEGDGKPGAELYDPKTRSWKATGAPLASRNTHTATRLPDGRVLVVGGRGSGAGGGASAELYDPKTGRFTATGSLLQARSGHSATLLRDGRVLVAGGYQEASQTYLATAELFDPDTGRWTATGTMIEAAAYDTATRLSDGTVLVAGAVRGTDEARITATVQLYDPRTGSWALTAAMHDARAYHTATPLTDGTVLVTGGTDSHDGDIVPILDSAERYDPATRSWTLAPSMDGVRVSHTATLLIGGGVLVAGGAHDYTGDGLLDTAELYDLGS